MAEIDAQHPGDPSVALLCTQLWNMQQEQGSYAAALEQARRAYDLMIGEAGCTAVLVAQLMRTSLACIRISLARRCGSKRGSGYWLRTGF